MTAGRQDGYALLSIAAFLVLLAGAAGLYRLHARELAWARTAAVVTAERLKEIDTALISFAALNRRLPCPANPNAAVNTGAGGGETGRQNGKCAAPPGNTGAVPWATLGLESATARDGAGGRITYNVYDGDGQGNGSLVQPNGIDFTACSLEATQAAAPPCRFPVLSAADVSSLHLVNPVNDPGQYTLLASAFEAKTLSGLGTAYTLGGGGQSRAESVLVVATAAHQWIATAAWPASQEWPTAIMNYFAQAQ